MRTKRRSSPAPARSARSRSRPTWRAAAPISARRARTPTSTCGRSRRLGGLYVIGTNRHESLRIDNQLRGRAGRQGDPGSSRFFIGLDDDLIERYGVMALIPKTHRPAPHRQPVDDPIVAREIARAQRIVEGQNFEIRRTLWRYSALVDEHAAIVYRWRHELLHGEAEPACGRSGAGQVRDARRRRRRGRRPPRGAARHACTCSTRVGRAPRAHRGHPRRHSPAALRRPRAGRRVPPADRRGVLGDDGARQRRSGRDLRAARGRDGAIDLAAAGLAGSSSTWTYLVNDNPFSTLGQSLIASRNIGAAAAERIHRGDVSADHDDRDGDDLRSPLDGEEKCPTMSGRADITAVMEGRTGSICHARRI